MLVLIAAIIGVGLALCIHYITSWLRLNCLAVAVVSGGFFAAFMTWLAIHLSIGFSRETEAQIVGVAMFVGLIIVWLVAGALGISYRKILPTNWLFATLSVFNEVFLSCLAMYTGGILRPAWIKWKGGWLAPGNNGALVDAVSVWFMLSLIVTLIVLSVWRPFHRFTRGAQGAP